jgi:hypothetical protein
MPQTVDRAAIAADLERTRVDFQQLCKNTVRDTGLNQYLR